MDATLIVVAPVFGVVLIGWVAARRGLISASAVDGLTAFVFRFAIPALLFRTLAVREMPGELPWAMLGAFYLAISTSAVVAWGFGGRRFPGISGERTVLAFCAGFGNVVLLGVPLMVTGFGPDAALPVFFVISFHSTVLMPVMTVLFELSKGQAGSLRALPGNVGRGIVTNPVIVSLAAGTLWNLGGAALPVPVDTILEMLGSAALPCALFAMGASLARFRLAEAGGGLATIVTLKNVVCPAIAWVVAVPVLNLGPLEAATAVILAAQPTGINPYLFAERYRVGTQLSASAVLVSTLVSVPILALLVGVMGGR